MVLEKLSVDEEHHILQCPAYLRFFFSKQKTATALQQLDKQRSAAQKDLEPLLSKDSNGPTSSTLPQKLSDAKNKQDSLAALIDLYRKKYVQLQIYVYRKWKKEF